MPSRHSAWKVVRRVTSQCPLTFYFSHWWIAFLSAAKPLMCWLGPQMDHLQRMDSAAAGLAYRTWGGAHYLICSQAFTRRKARQLSLISLGELASSAETCPNNILPPSWWLPAIVLHLPLLSFCHHQQLLLGCWHSEVGFDRQRWEQLWVPSVQVGSF